MLVVGIDENGLGPLLGPLVVTAVAFNAPSYNREAFWRAVTDGLPADDSKKLFKKNRIKAAEAATLSWLGVFGLSSSTHAELSAKVTRVSPFPLPCQGEIPEHCHPSPISLPVWAEPVQMDALGSTKGHFSGLGITPEAVRSVSVCPGILNAATQEPSMNKFRLDFHLMIHLVKALVGSYRGDLLALCGKVGSTRRYGPWLDGAGMNSWSAREESPESSTYEIDGIGRVSFIRDADGLHLPVALASMVGKYLRELSMRELNQLLAVPGVRPASGYRDPVTAKFVAKTAKRRLEVGLQDSCFMRNS